MAKHAKLSPSSADRWTSCTASIDAQEGIPNETSEASRPGTTCHQMMAECLVNPEIDLQDYLDRKMLFWVHDGSDSNGEDWESAFADNADPTLEFIHEVVVTQEMINAVESALHFVREVYALKGGLLEVEQRVPVGHITGEEDGEGTSDVTLIGDGWIHVTDGKFGRNKIFAYDVLVPAHTDIIDNVEVPAKMRPNLQMAMYALGALEKFELFGPFETITMTVVQPFVNHVSEFTCTVEELMVWFEFLQVKAIATRENPEYVPSHDNCHFCRRRGNCAPQDAWLLEQTIDMFDDVTQAKPKHVADVDLGTKYAIIPLLYDWAEAVTARVNEQLRQGVPVTRSDGLGYKLVNGKKGDRTWTNIEEVEEYLKRIRLKDEEIYKKTLKSPAQLEPMWTAPKTKKGQPPIPAQIGPTQKNRLATLITQSNGKPTVALETDPRPALGSATDGFGDVEDGNNADLF